MNNNYLSYKQLMHDRIKFQRAGGVHGSDFNVYDIPGAQYFRILFHFFGVGDNEENEASGLLHPTWLLRGMSGNEDEMWGEQFGHEKRAREFIPWRYNTAYSYLITNDEQERAQYLRRFIELLSNINSESPWYFQSVKGIEEALNRKQLTEEFTFPGERGKLTIECLPDSADQRIATLLDLYRALSKSWINKREILPANLRKFDMSIIVFQVPFRNIHTPRPDIIKLPDVLGMTSALLEDDDDWASMDPNQSNHMIASYKIYEFHNCEFDYNSTTGAADGITNNEPFQTTYNIGIFYDDMYEIRYNEFMDQMNWDYSSESQKYSTDSSVKTTALDMTEEQMKAYVKNYVSSKSKQKDAVVKGQQINEITDLVLIDTAAWQQWDINSEPMGQAQLSDYQQINSERLPQDGLLIDAVKQVSSMLAGKIDSKINRLFLGNLFGFSLQETAQQIANTLNGNVLGGINYAKSAIRGNYNGSKEAEKPYKKLFDNNPEVTHELESLGNIFKTASALSNI